MRVKELMHWLDAFGLPQSPWTEEPADWATALNLLARMLHPTLAKRVEEGIRKEEEEKEGRSEREEEEEEENEGREREEGGGNEGEEGERGQKQQLISRRPSSQMHPSTQLPFQETMELAERVLGVPQFAVVADLKRASSDNQLALFVSLCALHFALGPADTKSYRDFQFAFRIYFDMDSDRTRRECAGCGKIVHLIERLVLDGQVWHRSCLKCGICGRQLYRGAFHFVKAHSRMECVDHGANAVLFGDPKFRFALPSSSSLPPSSLLMSQSLQMDKRASISMASSILSQSSPPPRPPPPKIGDGPKVSPMPRKEEERVHEEEAEEEETIEKKIASAAAARHDVPIPRPRTSLLKEKPVAEKTSCWEVLEYPEELNPFGSDEEEVGEEENGRKEAEQGPNPFDTDSEGEGNAGKESKGGDGGGSAENGSIQCHSPGPQMVKLLAQTGQQEEGSKSEQPVANLYHKVLSVDCPQMMDNSQPKYFPPIGPMPFRVGLEKHSPPPASTSGNLADQQQQMIHELDTKLRRLHSQLDQWEITGARIEGQILRELGQKENGVWRKGCKLTNEFGQLVGQRCAALAMEGILVRRYMDAFLGLAHAELDRQMKEEQGNGGKMRQFNDLLAQLLNIRNELTELEGREKEARWAAMKGTERKKGGEAKKAEKEKREKERSEQKKENEKMKSEKEEEPKEKAGGRLLKNTFKNLKKKL